VASEKNAKCCDRLRQALRERGVKQSELCEMTKIPKSAISQYVSGAFEPKQDRIYLFGFCFNGERRKGYRTTDC
jgi:transcriptional regulator with XRE-family HTH domain